MNQLSVAKNVLMAGTLVPIASNLDWKSMAEAIAQRRLTGQLLKKRSNEVLIVRAPVPNGGQIVAKLWNRPTWKGTVRRMTRTNVGYREWQVLHRLQSLGLAVPQPLAYVVLDGADSPYTEALFSEDLGRCRGLGKLIKELAGLNEHDQLDSIEHDLIEITNTMIGGNVVDRDHRINNFVQRQSGQITRIDFELGSCVTWSARWRGHYGIMLGTLIGSYVFSVQPNVQRARTFTRNLMQRLNPPAIVLRRVDRVIQDMLQRQQRCRHIDTQFPSVIGI